MPAMRIITRPRPMRPIAPRPCELCYRPLIDGEERFCARCVRKAKKLGRL